MHHPLLAAAGFSPAADHPGLLLAMDANGSAIRVSLTTATIDNSTVYQAELLADPDAGTIPLRFLSHDPRDIVAFATAARSVAYVYQGDEPDERFVFVYEPDCLAIHNPFAADDQFGDWRVIAHADGALIVAADVIEKWRSAYTIWRDDLCLGLLGGTIPPLSSPLGTTAALPPSA